MFSVVGGDFGKLGRIEKIVLGIPDAVRLRAMFLYDSGISRLDLYHSDGQGADVRDGWGTFQHSRTIRNEYGPMHRNSDLP